MVTYDDIVQVLLVESGQYVADLTPTLLDKPKIILMIKRELAWYSRYMPHVTTKLVHLYNTKTFSMEIDGYIPDNIVDIRSTKMFVTGQYINAIPMSVHSWNWRYDKPVLYTKWAEGDYFMKYVSKHVWNDVNDNCESINLEDRVMNLILGRFLMSVGKSRRSFTLSDIPISSDAGEMISEGKELYEKTEEEIRTNSAFQLAIFV